MMPRFSRRRKYQRRNCRRKCQSYAEPIHLLASKPFLSGLRIFETLYPLLYHTLELQLATY
jgi:hypothetical protein